MTDAVSRWHAKSCLATGFGIATLNQQMESYLKELGYGA